MNLDEISARFYEKGLRRPAGLAGVTMSHARHNPATAHSERKDDAVEVPLTFREEGKLMSNILQLEEGDDRMTLIPGQSYWLWEMEE